MRPPRPSRRQMRLPLDGPAKYRPAEEQHEEIVRTLADLLLEAAGEPHREQTSQQRGENESED